VRQSSLLAHVASLEARKAMSYRADFWINVVVSFFAQLGVVWFLWTAIFATTGKAEIGGFSLPGMLQYYVLVILLGKLVRGPEMEGGVSQDIYDGGLSRYLLYPVSYWGFKYAQHLGALLPAVAQLVLFLLLLPLAPGGVGELHAGAGDVLLAAVAVLTGNLLYWLIQLPLQSVAFWADNVWSLSVLLRFVSGLLGGHMLPLDLFPPAARAVLDWLPFRFLYDLPVSLVLGRMEGAEATRALAVCLGWCVVLYGVSRLVWRKGERSYTGVGM